MPCKVWKDRKLIPIIYIYPKPKPVTANQRKKDEYMQEILMSQQENDHNLLVFIIMMSLIVAYA